FLDALAHHRQILRLPALSINWAAWSDVGLTAKHKLGARIRLRGLNPITPAQGTSILERVIGNGAAQVVVLPMHWPKFIAQFPSGQTPTLLSRLLSTSSLLPP